jgi:plastocyanin
MLSAILKLSRYPKSNRLKNPERAGGFMSRKAMVALVGLVIFLPAISSAVIHDISIQSFDFVPGNQTINQGDTVRWTNHDVFTHTSTSDNSIWNSGSLLNGQSFMWTFTSAGVFPYHCAIHLSMKDTLTVISVPTFDLQIDLGDNFFNPAVVQINIGQTIRWLNGGTMVHTSTADDGLWDSGNLDPGQFFDFTFASEGVHHFHCSYHPEMTGVVIVGRPDSVMQDIQIVDFAFTPPIAELTAGDYVRWINFGSMPHTTTDTSAGFWDSGNMNPGDIFILRATAVGAFNYICSYHPEQMTATLIVNPLVDWNIEIHDNFFAPAVIQINPGQTVRWMNMGIRVHTTTSNDGFWNSDSIAPGGHFDHTFPAEGVFHYHCDMHPLIMHGTVIVGKPDSVAFDIHIVDFAFLPAETTMTLGQNIRWLNFGSNMHTATDTTTNQWDSGTLNPGDAFTFHPGSPGAFQYICLFHPAMRGTLVVADTASGNCHYVTGDINGNGAANGIDVTYGVGYFKGGPPPPISCNCPPHGVIFPAGDVNGNCVFNGIDITYYVTYLKGGASLISCPVCPPGNLGRAAPRDIRTNTTK